MMSVTKSFAGLFALMAVADGLLDESTPITDIVPELAASSAFAGATVGQVMAGSPTGPPESRSRT
jgi:CubicO group peptidase (beta-lactamase class C family)